MLKPLTLSLGLAAAFGICSVGMAGHHGHALPSSQGVYPSEQGVVYPSAQGCDDVCGPVAKKRCNLFGGLGGLFKHRPKTYTYEWVLKKKRVRGHHGADVCTDVCTDTCAPGVFPSAQGVYPTSQSVYPAAQGGYPAPQAYGGDVYGSGQFGAPAYGAGQAVGTYDAGQGYAPADQSAEPPVIPSDDATQGPPDVPSAPPADNTSASNGGLLFLSPAGN